MTALTTDNFVAEIEAAPYVVQFWASWCGPCFSQLPDLLQMESLIPAVKFGRVNGEENPDLVTEYDVVAFPTLILFREGKPAIRFIGLHDFADVHGAIGKLT